MVTVYNVENLEVFFDTINQFQNPVTIQTKKGEYSEDLRNNAMLQEVLLSVAGEKGLEQICLDIEGKEDIDKIVMENPGYIRTGKNQMLKGGISDPRNKALMKMFNMIGIGERAGSDYCFPFRGRIQQVSRYRTAHWS